MLTYDPDKRPTGRDALKHEYWKAFPLPKRAGEMPTFPSTLTRSSFLLLYYARA
jgi:hypothetical protein